MNSLPAPGDLAMIVDTKRDYCVDCRYSLRICRSEKEADAWLGKVVEVTDWRCDCCVQITSEFFVFGILRTNLIKIGGSADKETETAIHVLYEQH